MSLQAATRAGLHRLAARPWAPRNRSGQPLLTYTRRWGRVRPANQPMHVRAIAVPLTPRGKPEVAVPSTTAPQPANRPPLRTAPVLPVPATSQPSPLLRIWHSYLASLQRRPLATKAITSFCCTLLGDSIAQVVGGAPYSLARCLKLGAWSACVGSTTGHHWHRWLDTTVFPHRPHSAAAVGMKVVLDQLCFTPVMTVAFFAFLKGGMEGTPHLILPFLETKLVSTLLAGYAVWPAVNLLMFRFVPADLRILFGNVIGLFWGIYLSLSCVNTAAVGPASGPGGCPEGPISGKVAVEATAPLQTAAVVLEQGAAEAAGAAAAGLASPNQRL